MTNVFQSLLTLCLSLLFVLSPISTEARSYSSSGYSQPFSGRSYYGSPRVDPQGRWVNGYTRKDGTHVRGHYRSRPDGTDLNNWTTRGNVNPHTGKPGTRAPRKYSK